MRVAWSDNEDMTSFLLFNIVSDSRLIFRGHNHTYCCYIFSHWLLETFHT